MNKIGHRMIEDQEDDLKNLKPRLKMNNLDQEM